MDTTTTRTLPTKDQVNAAKGAELRGLFALVFGRSTNSEKSTQLRKQVCDELDRLAAAPAPAPVADEPPAGAAEAEAAAIETASAKPEVPADDGAEDLLDPEVGAPTTAALAPEVEADAHAKTVKTHVNLAEVAETKGDHAVAAEEWGAVERLAETDALRAAAAKRKTAAQARVILARRGVKPKAPAAPKGGDEGGAPGKPAPKAKKASQKASGEPKAKKVREPRLRANAAKQLARARQNGVEVGQTLKHKFPDGAVATCAVVKVGVDPIAELGFAHGSTTYTSISAAANAAAKGAGQKSSTLNGWFFWGVEKRDGGAVEPEAPAVAAAGGEPEGVAK